MKHRNNVNLSLFIQLAKVNNNNNLKMNEKRSQKYQIMYPEYVTGQINSHILELFLLFNLCNVLKILICFSLIKRFPNDYERYSSHLQVSILHRVPPIKAFLP